MVDCLNFGKQLLLHLLNFLVFQALDFLQQPIAFVLQRLHGFHDGSGRRGFHEVAQLLQNKALFVEQSQRTFGSFGFNPANTR